MTRAGDRRGEALAAFSPQTRDWFAESFAEPTPAQAGAWAAIASGRHALVVAPTGSGKTLAAFLWALDRLVTSPPPADRAHRCRVLYVSPLKALGVDVERNLRAPLAGLRRTAERDGLEPPDITVGVRSGDTSSGERRRLASTPPDVLITTPESLYLMLTSAARESLSGVEAVIVDEVHAVAGTKRGAHLAVSLERLDALLDAPAQRIGLSATVRPHDEVARFLGGPHPVEVVAPPSAKRWDLDVVVPVPDMTDLAGAEPADAADDLGSGGLEGAGPPRAASIWPHVEERIVTLIEQHTSTLVFCNSRRLAERLTSRLNEIAYARAHPDADPGETSQGPPGEAMGASGSATGAPDVIARAHHGSVSKEQRALIEADLKAGRLPCVVATSSLELGIDMGAVDLVIQVEAPPSVASGLQRVGRAGHQVGERSVGVFFPKHRGDLVQTAITTERMRDGQIESLRIPANPLDVLAQHIVSATALDDWPIDELYDLVRRSAPFASLPRSAYEGVLDLLAGRYPSEEFAELRPRIVWDRINGMLTGRPGAQRLAVTSGGTIPDRGLFGVFLVGERASRVGELDEEMVYESRVGDVLSLGASSWRIEDITPDRVLVSPAPGVPGRLPFWKGDTLGRGFELGEAVGGFLRSLDGADAGAARERCSSAGLDAWATDNVLAYLDEQRREAGYVPHDRRIVVERCRDELGDWRLIVHSPFGQAVHAPWALVIAARVRERLGVEPQAMASDDGIVVRVPDSDAEPPGAELCLIDADDIEALVTDEVGASALFASRFRECSARALLLPRRNPGQRSPLWQQRQRSANLLQVAARYPSFPMVMETLRECLRDVYDVPALVSLMRQITNRTITISEVETPSPSPFARSLLFGYIAQFLYDGDSPLAERRAAALSIDAQMLAELLGRAELRDVLDAEVVAEVERSLQRLTPERRARTVEHVADLVRDIGPLSRDELTERSSDELDAAEAVATLVSSGRAIEVRIAGRPMIAATEDAGRLRDALGVPVPLGTPAALAAAVDDPLGDLIGRYARTHGPFGVDAVAARFGLGTRVVRDLLLRLAEQRRVMAGEFRPDGHGEEWIDTQVLARIRRRSLAAARAEVEPVDDRRLATMLPAWQHVGGRDLRGVDGVLSVVEQLDGAPLAASALESFVLPSRVRDYSPSMLDELTASGEVLWCGRGSLSSGDGWVSLHPADTAALTLPLPHHDDLTDKHRALLGVLSGGGAYFFRTLAQGTDDDAGLTQRLWDLVWAGHVTNDTLAPLRARLAAGGGAHRRRRPPPRGRRVGRAVPRASASSRSGEATTTGRWSLLTGHEVDATKRAHARAEAMLDRHGLVTRGAAVSEGVEGGFAALYRVLAALEESGKCRRGYFVEHLGAAQFALPGAVDRLRADPTGEMAGEPRPVLLAATDPANPFGAALPWPTATGHDPATRGHRPGRKAGALVVIVDGALTLFVERGGRTVVTFPDESRPGDEPESRMMAAWRALAGAVTDGRLRQLSIERIDGESALTSRWVAALSDCGFYAHPQGLRLRSTPR